MYLFADCSVSILPTFWFFPYFMEPRVTAALPLFTMLDYQVMSAVNLLYYSDIKKAVSCDKRWTIVTTVTSQSCLSFSFFSSAAGVVV